MERHRELRGKALVFLLALWFLWFINFSIRAIFSPILPLIEDEFMISHGRASSIFIFQAVGYGFSMFVSGFYSGRIGYKKTILFSLTVSSLVLFLIPFVKVFTVFYVFSFILGFSSGIYLPAALPMITEYFTENNWGKTIAIHDSAASIAIFATPFVALFLLHIFQWRGIFGFFAFVFLIGIILFCYASDEVKVTHSQKTMFGDLIKMKRFWIMTIIWVFAAGTNLGVYFIVPLYLTKELSLSIEYANTILGISRFGGIGVAVACGFLADRFSLRKIMCTMVLCAGIFTVIMGLASVRFIGIVLFFQAVFVTGFFPLALVSIARMFGREMRSMATGLILTISVILGGGVIPYLLGVSGDLISFRFGITILGIMVTLSSWLIFRLKELE